MTRLRFASGSTLLLAVVVLGCSQSNSQLPAKVSGSLSYKGQPVKGGTMAFHTADGTAYGATITEDGTYSASDLPEGELVVTVNTESLKPTASKGKDAELRKKTMQQPPPGIQVTLPKDLYVDIPDKYSKPNTSPLTVTLKSGRQVHNIELTD